MRKQILIIALGLTVFSTGFIGCKNNTDDDPKPKTDFVTMQQKSLNDFVDVVALSVYSQFKNEATTLTEAVNKLADNPSVANQQAAQEAWKEVRRVWEYSEAFLIGPVDVKSYDPYMDTWPTDVSSMQNLLSSSSPLTVQELEGFNGDNAAQLALRGFHPLEFLLWQDDVHYTVREKEYMVALATDIDNNVTKLLDSWLPSSGNFGEELIETGTSNSRYESNKDALKAIAGALAGICDEVGNGKMIDPFLPQPDSTKTESPYSHNSIIDFQNNIQGAYNVYLCDFDGQSGTSISDLVAHNNKTLDAQIKQEFQAALNSFSGITTTFEKAIYTQPNQVQNTIDAIQTLEETLNNDLMIYLEQYIKN